MHKRMIVVIGVLALCASCQKFAEGRQIFHDLLGLRDQLATQFHERVVDVNVSTGGRLTVKFVNSPLNSASREMKQARADEVTAFVKTHYSHPVSSVRTEFVSQLGGSRFSQTFIGREAPKP